MWSFMICAGKWTETTNSFLINHSKLITFSGYHVDWTGPMSLRTKGSLLLKQIAELEFWLIIFIRFGFIMHKKPKLNNNNAF